MQERKKIMLLVANPVKMSLSYSCGDIYEKTVTARGAEVRRFNIDEMDFDPVLHSGYDKIQELEPDLIAFQNAIKWADHLVFIYPNWWSTMPAKMKGLFDRAFLPGFAFKFIDNTFTPLLKGKSGRVINVVGSSHPLMLWCAIGAYTNELSRGILKLCGVSPVETVNFGATRNASKEKCARWLGKVRKMAEKDSGY